MSIRPMPMKNTMAARTALGMSVEQAGQEEHDDQDDERHGHVGDLGAAFCSSRIWVLVGLPLTTKVPVGRRRAGPAQPDDVVVHVDALVVLHGEAAGRRGALGDDQHEQENAMPSTLGMSLQVIPSAARSVGTRPERLRRSRHRGGRVEGGGQDGRQDHGDDGAGHLGHEPLEPQDDEQCACGEGDRPRVGVAEVVIVDHCCSTSCPCPSGSRACRGSDGEDLDTDAGQEPDEDARAEEVAQEPELEHPRQDQQAAADQRDQAGPGHPFGRVRCSPEIPSPARPAARIAAVAESAPTTSRREEPSRANINVGKMTVYRPVTTGVCAMEV